ncbi:metallophosphoesterase [Rhodospirillaceae bacterium SYSU D60014]|uniref:metallophosphoesterase n=1 Tax=Virgifigura deserti TaxID=2268457 RepID=UPI000E66425A
MPLDQTASTTDNDLSAQTTLSVAEPIMDIMVKRGTAARAIDLTEVFGSSDLTFTIENANGDVATDAQIDANGILTFGFGAIGHSDIRITATDGSGHSATDNVRVRVTGENAYTIAVLPDTQDYTSNPQLNHIFGDMTQWLVDNKDGQNIQFVVHVGDITQRNTAENWAIAEEALRKLDGEIPYSLLPGNHDQSENGRANDHTSDFLDSIFSPEKQAATNPTFGGVYDQEPTRSSNNYHTFAAPDGTKWLVLSMEFGVRDDVIRWAGDVIEAHADHRVIIANHSMTNFAGRHDPLGDPLFGEGTGYDYGMGNTLENPNDGEMIWRELAAKYPNVVMTFSGHIFGDGAETVTSYNQYGQPVHQMLVNYQNGVANEINGGNGGNGAIRLVVVDPDAGTISTQTYFTEFDGYLTGGRTEGELAGDYKEHEQVIEGLDLGPVVPQALANAGDDLFLSAPQGADELTVELDGSASRNPNDGIVEYRWLDKDGQLLATGEKPSVTLGVGRHELTLEAEDLTGQVTRDQILVTVSGDRTLLADNFNDGDAAGWTTVRPILSNATEFSTVSDTTLPELAGGDAEIMSFPPLEAGQYYQVKAGFAPSSGDDFDSYTIVMDLLVHDGQGDYFSLYQNDLDNENDGVIFIENNYNGTGSLEILRGIHGTINYEQWHRIALTVEKIDDQNATLTKYIDGALVGSQVVAMDRLKIDGQNGFLLLADDNGESGYGHLNNLVFSDKVFSAAEIATLGGPAAGAMLTEVDDRTVQFTFDGDLSANLGSGTIDIVDKKGDALEASTRFGSTNDFTLPELAGGEGQVMFFPAPTERQGFVVQPASGDPAITQYSIVMDILVPPEQGRYLSLLQTDTTNSDDGDIFIRDNGDGTAGVGGGGYDTGFVYGEWQRIALVVEQGEDGTMTLHKYVNGSSVGSRVVDAERFTLDGENGFLLFADESREMVDAYVNSVAFTENPLSAEDIATIGGPSAGGIFSTPIGGVTQFDFSTDLSASFGDATLNYLDESETGFWQVKGTVHSRTDDEGLDAAEGKLYYSQDNPNKILVWNDAEALSWTDYVYDVTLRSTDDDTIGTVFYFQDASNYYRFEMDSEGAHRSLIKVENGEETVLAETRSGYRFNDEIDLRVAVVDGAISVFLEDKDVFGGPVVDETPIAGGTIGVYSSNQKSAIFDNVMVNQVALTAHGACDMRSIDTDGDGTAEVNLTAAGTFGPDAVVSYRWLLDGEQIAQGKEVNVDLPVGTKSVLLEAADAAGNVSTDVVNVDIVAKEKVLLSVDFNGGDLSDWTIIDEGDIGGASDWQLQDGALVQHSDVHSKQLTWGGNSSHPDPWQRGWSPLGDGHNALRKGTYALYNKPEAAGWTDYSVEVTVDTPDDDGLGVLLHYQDPNNYYKMELDSEGGYWQLRSMVDGYEKTLGQVPGKYVPGQQINLRVDILDGMMQAFVDGEAVFAYRIGDKNIESGTVGLYSWGSQGVSFDDLNVISLVKGDGPSEPNPDQTLNGTAGDDTLTGGTGNDRLYGKWGDDILNGGAGNDLLDGGIGNDVLTDLVGNNRLFGGAGDDVLESGDGDDLLDAGEGDDIVRTTGGNNQLFGDGGDDVLESGDGDDRLMGGHGDDALQSGAGDDELVGGIGDDLLQSGSGDNRLFGGAGDDVLESGDGDDLLDGGEGHDVMRAGAGDDELTADGGDDLLEGGDGDDRLLGGHGEDMLRGGSGDDELQGGAGADDLEGGDGDDRLLGGSGNDRLAGGLGDDVLAGGSGDDAFVFVPSFGQDVVADFDNGRDVIEFDASLFADFDAVVDSAEQIGSDVVITLDPDNVLTLARAHLSHLQQDDFRFV